MELAIVLNNTFPKVTIEDSLPGKRELIGTEIIVRYKFYGILRFLKFDLISIRYIHNSKNR